MNSATIDMHTELTDPIDTGGKESKSRSLSLSPERQEHLRAASLDGAIKRGVFVSEKCLVSIVS